MNRTDRRSKRNDIFQFVLLMVVVAAFLYFTFMRYNFIGNAISRGDTASAALLFTPEISSSVANIMYGV